MIQSVVLTPTLPDQDEEKLSPGLCVKIKKSIQTNHKRVRISKSKIKVLLHACLVVFPSFLPFLPCLISPLSPCRGAWPFLSLSAVPGVLSGERLPSALPQLLGGEPAVQVSAQNKYSWLSYEPPEG